MSRFDQRDGHTSAEELEQKLSPSSVGLLARPVVAAMPSPQSSDGYELYASEQRPIPYPGSQALDYPILPPAGPPGPGS
jgi:hypothetical protein